MVYVAVTAPRVDEWPEDTLIDGRELLAWKVAGRCNGLDSDLFFPELGDDTRPAKAVCTGCPVREQCLEYALDNGEQHGIWGGLSERERRRIRTRRRLAA